jgi:PAS domain S-box-containing protein
MDNVNEIQGNEIFKALFENSAVGMSITTLDGRINTNSAFCEMIGYTKDELANKKWAEITHPEDIEYNNVLTQDIVSGRKNSARLEKRYLHKNGSIIWTDIQTHLYRDDKGSPHYFITTINDITERKKAEAESELKNAILQRSNAEKDKFFAILAHDLRGPLGSFLGLIEVMAEDINSMTIAEIEDITKALHASASSLFQLLENLLEWSVLKRGDFKCQLEKIALNRVILRSIDPIMESARLKNISVRLEMPQNYFVECDLKMTETIFRNLVSNALKFTHPGGSVVITAEPVSQGKISVSIKDSGIGMNRSMIQKLFQINEQVSRIGTEGESSSGLGLIICKEFIEKQGGEISVESKESSGSTFRVTLTQVSQLSVSVA